MIIVTCLIEHLDHKWLPADTVPIEASIVINGVELQIDMVTFLTTENQ